MTQLTESVANVIEEFAKLPGIGKKSAERLAYHISARQGRGLGPGRRDSQRQGERALLPDLLQSGGGRRVCRSAGIRSAISDSLCVVEQPRDLMALEQTGVYRGSVSRAAGADCAAGRNRARTS